MLNCVDLFAGPGGLSLGFEMARDNVGQKAFNLLMAVERDSLACKMALMHITQGSTVT